MTETQYTHQRRMPESYGFRDCEIKVLQSLKKERKTVELARNSSLWQLAKEEYCAGEMYFYIAALNPQLNLNSPLKIGQPIVLEPIFSFILLGDKIVEPGDSLWKRWKATDRSVDWPTYRRSLPGGRNDLIYPLQVDDIEQRKRER